MLQFPEWTEVGTAQERARLRLRFLVNHLASLTSPCGSIENFAEAIGISKNAIYYSQRRGYFSKPVANLIVALYADRSGVTREMLTDKDYDISQQSVAGTDGEL